MNEKLRKIKRKIFDNLRLTKDDAMYLYLNCPLLELAELANCKKEQIYKDHVFYIINQHINYTNICILRCPMCAFSKSRNDEGAYLMSIDEIISKVNKDVSEFHIVGGINDNLDLEYFTNLFSKLKTYVPNATIKALTPVEIDFLAKKENKTYREILSVLKQYGLGMLPGGGAEIFSEKVRKIICPKKINSNTWLEIMKQAHMLGIPSNATMLYGHIESPEDIVEHLNSIRKLQDQTKGFLAFIPLSFHPMHTKFDSLKPSTAYNDLKIISLSRLFLDNIPHIKAYWVMLSPKLAQVSLFFGADDIDGTIKEENIFHAAGSTSSICLSEYEIQEIITSAHKTPVKRDSFYNPI
jgi:aminodeoxyfutalosine synthase